MKPTTRRIVGVSAAIRCARGLVHLDEADWQNTLPQPHKTTLARLRTKFIVDHPATALLLKLAVLGAPGPWFADFCGERLKGGRSDSSFPGVWLLAGAGPGARAAQMTGPPPWVLPARA